LPLNSRSGSRLLRTFAAVGVAKITRL